MCVSDSKLVPMNLISDAGPPKNHMTDTSGQGIPPHDHLPTYHSTDGPLRAFLM